MLEIVSGDIIENAGLYWRFMWNVWSDNEKIELVQLYWGVFMKIYLIERNYNKCKYLKLYFNTYAKDVEEV